MGRRKVYFGFLGIAVSVTWLAWTGFRGAFGTTFGGEEIFAPREALFNSVISWFHFAFSSKAFVGNPEKTKSNVEMLAQKCT